jgi:hypothetical protein
MADGKSAVAQGLRQFGNSLQHLGQTIYTVDARNQADLAMARLAGTIQDWETDRLADPDYGEITIDPATGAPIFKGGYTEKWEKTEMEIKQNLIGGIQNPLARQEVERYFNQAATRERGVVQKMQFDKWGAALETAKIRLIADADDKTHDPDPTKNVQAKLDYAKAQIDELTKANLWSPEIARKALEGHAQSVIGKDLTARAKEALRTGDLAAAEILIGDDRTTYMSGADTFKAGDQVKAEALSDVRLFYNAKQKEAETGAQAEFYAYRTRNPGRVSEETLLDAKDQKATREKFQAWATKDGYILDSDRRQYWEDRLEAYDNGRATGGGTKAEAMADYWDNKLEQMAGALILGRGNAQITYIDPNSDPEKPTTITIPVTVAAYEALRNHVAVLDAFDTKPGAYAKANARDQRVYNPEKGAFPVTESMEAAWNKWVTGKPNEAALREEYEALKKANLNTGKLNEAGFQELVDKLLKKPEAERKLGKLIGWDPRTINDYDAFIGQRFDGNYADVFRKSGPGEGDRWDGSVKNPNFAWMMPTLEQEEKDLEKLGVNIGKPWIDSKGRAWYSGKASEIKDPPKAGALSVSYSVFPFAEGKERAATRFRDIVYKNNDHRKQMLINDGTKDVWMDVLEPGERGNPYQDRYTLPPEKYAALLKARGQARTAAESARNAQENAVGLATVRGRNKEEEYAFWARAEAALNRYPIMPKEEWMALPENQ